MEIICEDGCGNAPRQLLLKDINIAFAQGDVDLIMSHVSDDITWDMIGDKKINGKDKLQTELEEMKGYTAKKLVLENIITHGRMASANGIMHMKDGKCYGFCDVYVFNGAGKNAKIKRMTSYCLAIND